MHIFQKKNISVLRIYFLLHFKLRPRETTAYGKREKRTTKTTHFNFFIIFIIFKKLTLVYFKLIMEFRKII